MLSLQRASESSDETPERVDLSLDEDGMINGGLDPYLDDRYKTKYIHIFVSQSNRNKSNP